jgi:RNA polymerase sigma-70 factor (ECF subfamily)
MSGAREQALSDAARRQEAERDQEQLWIERALLGEAAAFRCLVERHERGVRGLITRMVSNGADGDELVQETFARAYCALEQFDSRFRFSTWLYRIALNLCRDHRKSAKRRERAVGLEVDSSDSDADVQPSPELSPDHAARLLRLHSALQRLPPKDYEVIVLKDLQDLSYDEIREITGTPVTALKIRTLRARARLQALMHDAGVRGVGDES